MRGRSNAEAKAKLRDKPIEMIQMQDFSDFEINIDMDEDEEEEEGRIYTQDLPLHLRVEAPDLQVVPEEESDISLHEC